MKNTAPKKKKSEQLIVFIFSKIQLKDLMWEIGAANAAFIILNSFYHQTTRQKKILPNFI